VLSYSLTYTQPLQYKLYLLIVKAASEFSIKVGKLQARTILKVNTKIIRIFIY